MKALCAFLLALGALAAWGGDDGKVNGKTLYRNKCATCHGIGAKGNPTMAKIFEVPPSAMDLRKKESLAKKDEELALVISQGKGAGKMPAFSGVLNNEEVTGILAFIRSLGPSAKPENKKSTKPNEEKKIPDNAP